MNSMMRKTILCILIILVYLVCQGLIQLTTYVPAQDHRYRNLVSKMFQPHLSYRHYWENAAASTAAAAVSGAAATPELVAAVSGGAATVIAESGAASRAAAAPAATTGVQTNKTASIPARDNVTSAKKDGQQGNWQFVWENSSGAVRLEAAIGGAFSNWQQKTTAKQSITVGPRAEPLIATGSRRDGFATVLTPPIAKQDGADNLTIYSLPHCPCQRLLPPVTDHGTLLIQGNRWQRRVPRHSICSDAASARGPGQKVVSYVYFGNWSNSYVSNRYFTQIEERAVDIKTRYPEFLMRVYHNLPPVGPGWDSLCKLHCQYPHIDLCSVTDLPAPWGDISYINARMWRFFAMMDPLVDIALSRDLDSWILYREEAVVREWLASNISCHMIRDHPWHGIVLAGLWGARLDFARGTFYHMVGLMLSHPEAKYRAFKGADQSIMGKLMWPYLVEQMMVHDSYHCGKVWNSRVVHGAKAFLTEREGQKYIGSGPTKIGPMRGVTTCPIACRPPHHQDWLKC